MKPEVLEAIAEDLTAVMDGMMDVDVTTSHLGKGCAEELPHILREHIPPLEWVRGEAFTQAGIYQILSGEDNSFGFRVSSPSTTTYWSWETNWNWETYWSWDSKKEAQDAAKDHYIDSLMKAMGLE